VASPVPTHMTPWLVWPAAALGLALLAWVRRIEYATER